MTDTRNIMSNWLYPTAANPGGTIEVAGQGGVGGAGTAIRRIWAVAFRAGPSVPREIANT